MKPINSAEFKNLKTIGIIAEMAVQETATWNIELYAKLQEHTDSQLVMFTRDVPIDAPYDLLGYAVNNNFFKGFSIEVKSAKNGGRYRTFYAELYQIGSMSYAEYLIHPPRYMVYVDTFSQIHFWYDGKVFAEAVKRAWDKRIPNNRGTAVGVRFDILDPEYGYLWSYAQSRPSTDIYHTRRDEITMLLQVQKPTPNNKQCSGLPDLNTHDVI